MPQAPDFTLADQFGATFRTELNTILAALASQNSGSTAPTTTYPGMLWADTSSGQCVIRMRNVSDTGWLEIDQRPFGLGMTAIGTVASINAITETGWWRSLSSDAGNPPNTEGYRLMHITGGGTASATQIAIGETSGRVWSRNRVSGSWGSWAELLTGPLTTSQIAAAALRTSGEGFASLLDTEVVTAAWARAFGEWWAYESTPQTITSGSVLNLAHGLGARPTRVELKLRCTTAQAPYAVNDEVDAMISIAGPIYGATATADATNIEVRVGSGGVVAFTDTGTALVLTNTSWRIIVRARL